MEVVAMDVDTFHLGIGEFDAGQTSVAINLAFHFQPGVCGSGSERLGDWHIADKRSTAPALHGERKQ